MKLLRETRPFVSRSRTDRSWPATRSRSFRPQREGLPLLVSVAGRRSMFLTALSILTVCFSPAGIKPGSRSRSNFEHRAHGIRVGQGVGLTLSAAAGAHTIATCSRVRPQNCRAGTSPLPASACKADNQVSFSFKIESISAPTIISQQSHPIAPRYNGSSPCKGTRLQLISPLTRRGGSEHLCAGRLTSAGYTPGAQVSRRPRLSHLGQSFHRLRNAAHEPVEREEFVNDFRGQPLERAVAVRNL